MGGKGYVFQSRFSSTVIQDDAYLLQAILYVLNNPVRVGIVWNAADYRWSSIGEYFNRSRDGRIDHTLVEGMLSGKRALFSALRSNAQVKIAERKSRYGPVFGDERFMELAEERYDRRNGVDDTRNCRNEDIRFEPVEKIYWEFSRKIGGPVEKMNLKTHEGKRHRANLLVMLKDLGGLTYREVMELDEFRGLSFSSLGSIYANAKNRK